MALSGSPEIVVIVSPAIVRSKKAPTAATARVIGRISLWFIGIGAALL